MTVFVFGKENERMYIGEKDIGKMLMNDGYSYYQTLSSEWVYWTIKDGIQKLVVIESLVNRPIFSAEKIHVLKQNFTHKFEALKEENILFILLGNKNTLRACAENTILIEENTLKVKHGKVTSQFKCEKTNLDNLRQYKLANDLQLDSTYGALTYSCSFFVIVSLIMLLLYIHFKVGSGAGADFGINSNMVLIGGQSYRLITYMFVHASIPHLIGNLLSLFIIGKLITKRVEFFDFLAIFIGGGMFAGYFSVCMNFYFLNKPTTITVGSSGAIFALLGAYSMSILLDESYKGRKRTIIMSCISSIVLSSLCLRVDNVCHITGLLTGSFIMYVIVKAHEYKALKTFLKTETKKEKLRGIIEQNKGVK